MSDPPRFAHENRLSGRLLRSARADAAPSHARERTFVALGLGASATVTTGTAAGTGGAVSSGVAAKASLALLLAKVALSGAALTGVTMAVVHHVRTSRAPLPQVLVHGGAQKTTPRAIPSSFAPARPSHTIEPIDSIAPIAAIEPSQPSTAPTSVSAPEHRPAAAVARGTSSAAVTAEGLADEVAFLDSAHEALASGQTARALSIVNQYEHGSSSKALFLEAQVLRIEALVQQGDAAHATKLAQAFLTQHPSSALAARVHSLLLASQKSAAR